MPIDVEAEIRELKRRVSELEGSFGFLTKQVQGVHKDLLRFEEKTDSRLQSIDSKLLQHDGRFDRLEQDLKGLRSDLPKIVGDAMREVNREISGRKR